MGNTLKAYMQVLETGVYASVQDGGRPGYLHWGVPHSGFMDKALAALANEMVGNSEQEACIEFFKQNFTIRFSKSAQVAIAGINIEFSVNDELFYGSQRLFIPKGGIIRIISVPHHNWAYLSVAGGLQSEKILGSKSMMKGVTTFDRLYKEMSIPFSHSTSIPSDMSVILGKEEDKAISIKKGPEFANLPDHIQKNIFKNQFAISPQSNRQAYVLEGFDQPLAGAQIKSGYTPAGTIQMTPSGKLFVLMKDGQTTGGYFRIGFLDQEDLAQLAQITFGEFVQFRMERS